MLSPHSNILSRLGVSGETPIYYLQLHKSEGLVDPDSAADEWPNPTGSGAGDEYRIFTTGTIAWTTRAALLADSNLHEDRLNRKSIAAIVEKLSGADRAPGGLASVDSIKVSLDNTDGGISGRTPDAAFDGVNFEGRKVWLSLTFDDVTSSAASLVLFTGQVNDVKIAGGSVTLEIEGRREVFDAELPPNIFENVTADVIYAESTLGKSIPLVFGAHDMAPGFLVSDTKDTGAADAGRIVKFADVSGAHDIDSVDNFRYGDSGLSQATGGFADIRDSAGKSPYTVDASEGEVYFDDLQVEKLYLAVTIGFSSWLAHAVNCVTSDIENTLDDDTDNYSEVVVVDNPAVSHLWRYKVPYMTTSATIEEIHVSYKVAAAGMVYDNSPPYRYIGWNWAIHPDPDDSAFGDSCDNYGLGMKYNNGATISAIEQLSAHGGAIWGDYNSLAEISNYFLSAGLSVSTTNAADGDATFAVYGVYLFCYCYIDIPDRGYYAEINGYEDDGSGTYTGSASSLIENPLHLLAFISAAFNPAISAAGDIETADLQTAATAFRSGWKFARSLTDQKDWKDYAKGLCKEALSWAWINAAGKLTAQPWDATDTVDMTIDPSMIAKGELDGFGTSRLEEVVTDFTIKYKLNTVRDEFDKVVLCNSATSSVGLGATYESLCEWAAYDNGGYEKAKTWELDWVRDEATAIEVAKKIVAYYTRRRRWIKFTGDLPLIVLERADRVNLDPTAHGWANEYDLGLLGAKYRVTEKRIRPDTDTVTIKAVEVI